MVIFIIIISSYVITRAVLPTIKLKWLMYVIKTTTEYTNEHRLQNISHFRAGFSFPLVVRPSSPNSLLLERREKGNNMRVFWKSRTIVWFLISTSLSGSEGAYDRLVDFIICCMRALFIFLISSSPNLIIRAYVIVLVLSEQLRVLHVLRSPPTSTIGTICW